MTRLPPDVGCFADCLVLELWGVTQVSAEHAFFFGDTPYSRIPVAYVYAVLVWYWVCR